MFPQIRYRFLQNSDRRNPTQQKKHGLRRKKLTEELHRKRQEGQQEEVLPVAVQMADR